MDPKQLVILAFQISIVCTVFGFGLQTRLDDLLYLVRQPGLLVRSLISVFVIMPVVAVAIARWFDFPRTVMIALIALSISPTPPLLPRREAKSGGHESYGLGLMALLAAVYGALYFSERLVRPVQDLIAGTRAVAKGDFDTRLLRASHDEVGFLVTSFNDMTKKLARAREETERSRAAVEAERAALAVILGFIVVAVAAPQLAPYDPTAIDYRALRKPPSAAHPLGTDEVGRDVLSRLLWGARASLLAGVIPVSIAVAISVPLGLLSGVVGGWIDGLIMRINDAMLSIPFLIVAIALAAFLGPGLGNAMIAIGIAALPTFVRLVRGTVLAVRTEEYVEAAHALGCSRPRVAVRHILPNTLPPLFVQMSITVAAAIIAEASLSFLGLGQQPPAPSWGSMLNAAQRYLSQAPWMALYPGLMIFGIVMALNVLGDGLRDVLDPRHQ